MDHSVREVLITARNYDSLIIDLDVVDVTSTRLSKPEEERKNRRLSYSVYSEPSFSLVIDSMPGARTTNQVFDLFYRLPGVQIVGNSIQIQGTSSFVSDPTPTFFVNGMQVDLAYITQVLTVQEIDFIDVLRGGDASIFGVRGGNGVILIYTRSGNTANPVVAPGILNSRIYGFHKAREFAVFDPNLPGNQNRPDLRTTLHWNPNLRGNAHEIIKESFTTSDQSGQFLIIIQGLRKDGQVLFGMKKFEVH